MCGQYFSFCSLRLFAVRYCYDSLIVSRLLVRVTGQCRQNSTNFKVENMSISFAAVGIFRGTTNPTSLPRFTWNSTVQREFCASNLNSIGFICVPNFYTRNKWPVILAFTGKGNPYRAARQILFVKCAIIWKYTDIFPAVYNYLYYSLNAWVFIHEYPFCVEALLIFRSSTF